MFNTSRRVKKALYRKLRGARTGPRIKLRRDGTPHPATTSSRGGGTPLRSLSTTPLHEYDPRAGIYCPNSEWPCTSHHVTCSFAPIFARDFQM